MKHFLISLSFALIVSNTSSSAVTFNVQYNGMYAPFTLESGVVGTYIWE